MLDELNPPAIHGEAIAGRSAEARRALLQITAGVVRSTFDLAELLYEVKSAGYYRAYGYETFGEYVMKELDIKQRKSEYLIRIVQVCKAVGLKRADYESAGVSKLRDITTLDPEGSWFNPETKTNEDMAEHIVDLIANAQTMTSEEVTERVLELKGMTGDDRPVVRSCSMTQSTWDNVVKVAYERMRLKLGSAGRDDQGMAREYTDGVCLECICADWLAGESEQPEDETGIPMEGEI
jgi:hypothetical protein